MVLETVKVRLRMLAVPLQDTIAQTTMYQQLNSELENTLDLPKF